MNTVAKICVESDVNNLVKLRRFLYESTSALGVPNEKIDDIILAVDEAATNIMIHGYQGQRGMIEIYVNKLSGKLSITIKDKAPNFDPTHVKPPDITLPLEKRPLGRYGVYLIKNNVDEMIYETPPEGGNQLTLIKNI